MYQYRAALVTGGAQRLGEVMARHLVLQGYSVALHYNTNATRAQAIAQELEKRHPGTRVVPLAADLCDEKAIAELVPRAADALGTKLDLLINNASIFEPDSLLDATERSWDRHMKTNLQAPFFLTQAFAKQLGASDDGGGSSTSTKRDERGEPLPAGLVLNMIDQRVRKPTPEFATYTLAKQALWAFTQTAAQSLAPSIRVNAIGPGPTLKGGRQDEATFAGQRRSLILQRGSNPEDIAGALAYFLAAPGVTGQLLCVDGGQHLAWQTPDVAFKE